MTSIEKFLLTNTTWAQAHANAGHETLDLYMDENGAPRILLQGWPSLPGWRLLRTVEPSVKVA